MADIDDYDESKRSHGIVTSRPWLLVSIVIYASEHVLLLRFRDIHLRLRHGKGILGRGSGTGIFGRREKAPWYRTGKTSKAPGRGAGRIGFQARRFTWSGHMDVLEWHDIVRQRYPGIFAQIFIYDERDISFKKM